MSGKQFSAKIAENLPINAAAGAYLLRLEVPPTATRFTPGQFVHILCGDPEERLLRRAFAICHAQEKPARITICYHVCGAGTTWLSERAVGETLDVMGPLGVGFTKSPVSRVLLVGEGVGLPALLPLAKAYGKHATVLLGYPSGEGVHLRADFEQTGAAVRVFVGNDLPKMKREAKSLLRSGKLQVAHLAAEMGTMRQIANCACDLRIPCEVMLTPKLACGVGACRGCTRMMQIGGKRVPRQVCHDGPVFDARQMLWEM